MKPATNLLRGLKDGLAHLLDQPVLHHHDPVAQGHGLDLIVSDVDDGRLKPVVKALQLHPHLDAELGVQVRERLVEEEDLGVADDGAADRHALALAARELPRLPLEQLLDPQQSCRLPHPRLDLGLGELPHLEPERHVVVDGHVRVEGVVLEDHGNVAVLGGQVVHEALADVDLPRRDLLEAGDHPEGGGLPAPRRADEDHELLVPDVEVHVLDRVHLIELLVQILQHDLCHRQASWAGRGLRPWCFRRSAPKCSNPSGMRRAGPGGGTRGAPRPSARPSGTRRL